MDLEVDRLRVEIDNHNAEDTLVQSRLLESMESRVDSLETLILNGDIGGSFGGGVSDNGTCDCSLGPMQGSGSAYNLTPFIV